jgi:hypothetical protein
MMATEDTPSGSGPGRRFRTAAADLAAPVGSQHPDAGTVRAQTAGGIEFRPGLGVGGLQVETVVRFQVVTGWILDRGIGRGR